MLYDLLVLASVIGCGWLGIRLGLGTISTAAFEMLTCAIGAAIVHEPIVAFLDAGARMILGDMSIEAWLYPLVYAALTAGTFAGLRRFMHRDSLLPGDPREDAPLEKAAAALAGGLGGFVAMGTVMIGVSMLPVLASIKPSPGRMMLDAGGPVLRATGAFTGETHDGRSLPVYGEPPSRPSDPNARLTSEPWFDADLDGGLGENERFSDVDGNGVFTKDLYYSDLDGDGTRRLGLLDKYFAGCWKYEVLQFDRERPDAPKPVEAEEQTEAPAEPAPAEPAPAEPPPAEPRPAEPPPAEPPPAEPPPAEPPPAEPPPAEPPPAEPPPAEPAPAEPAPAEPAL